MNKCIQLLVIVLAACLTQVASDIYAPSILSIAKNLSVPLDKVQWSMAIYMLGVCLSQLVYGPLSEGVGRKAPLVAGLLIMLVGSLICWYSYTIDLLIFGRLIQGCGAGACAALWRSIFRDTYSGEDLAKYGSYLVIFIMFIVPAAPMLGGIFEQYFGWRTNFAFMSGYSLLVVAATLLGFKETNIHRGKERLKLSLILQTYVELLKSRLFMGMTFCTFLCAGSFFSWFVIGPVLFIEVLGLTPLEYGWITFLGGGAGYGAGGLINGRVVKHFGMHAMLRWGLACMFTSGLILVAMEYTQGINIVSAVISLILFYFGSTFIWPNAFAAAFTPFGHIAGYAGALYGFMQIGGAAVIGGLMSFAPEGNSLSLATLILGTACLAWIVIETTLKNKSVS